MRKGIDCKGKEWEEKELTCFMKDLRQIKFGMLTPLFPVTTTHISKYTFWLCQCDCGNLIIRSSKTLNDHTSESCGCLTAKRRSDGHAKNRQSMIGCRFGKLTVIGIAYVKETNDGKRAYYKCVCDCGKEVVVRGTDLKLGKTASCGSCIRREIQAAKRKDLTGEIFGQLTVLGFAYIKNQTTYWHCKCVCGNEIIVRGADLKNGHTSSCGCVLSIGELNIMKILNNCDIKFLHNKGYFKDLVSDSGLPLRYDFIIFNEEVPVRLIEFDGPQHNKPNDLFGVDEFEKLQKYDTLKNQYALSHNIPLVRIPYTKRNNLILEDLLGDQFLIKGEK